MLQQHIYDLAVFSIVTRQRQRLQCDEMPGIVDPSALLRLADPDKARRRFLRLPRLFSAGHLRTSQQSGPRADVPGPPAHLLQRPTVVPAALAVARNAIDQDDVDSDVVFDMI